MSDGAPTRTKRGHHEGTVKLRKDGRWEAQVMLPTGKRISRYGKTAKEARDKMKAAWRDHEAGVDVTAKRQTVDQFLTRWLADVVRPGKAPKTHASYEEIVRLHLIPGLGRYRLDQLTPQHVAAMLRIKQDAGFSPRRVHHMRAVLRAALNQAIKWGLVGRNVAALTEPVRQAPRTVKPFTPEEARAVLVAARGHRLEALVAVALSLGLRQGEVLALMWGDLDLDGPRPTIAIQRSLQRVDGHLILKGTKTEKSRRTLPLPAFVAAILREHRDRQAFERKAAGNAWSEQGFVFTTSIGTPLDPRNVIRSWHALLAAAGVPRHRFHDTRHTAVSTLIAHGVSLKVIQELVGHSLLSTTADTYGHLASDAFNEAASILDAAYGTTRTA